MPSRWRSLVSLCLVAFACLGVAWQFRHSDRETALREWMEHGRDGARDNGIISSIYQSYLRSAELAKVSDITKRDQLTIAVSGWCRYVDLVLPKEARVFMPDMTGPTNYSKIGNYFFTTYYLFPRDVGVSVDQPTRLAKDGFLGRTAGSDHEILAHGYDAIVDFPPDGTLTLKLLKPLSELPLREPVTPAWFSSSSDTLIAFLLPLLTALSGMWLFLLLFPSLGGRIPWFEQMACSLGLGMMAVAAITLGVKLCGFHGRNLVLCLTAAGGIAETWRDRKAFLAGMAGGFSKLLRHPIVAAVVVAGLLVFLILFRLAGLQGLVDPDAMRWSLKAKIIHLCTGSEIVGWFSDPRLAHAHLDYPTLVPSLHAATYDSLGHVDEFVTKFWPTWMLVLLLGALASLTRGGSSRFHAPYFALLGVLLLPVTQKYVQTEGGTLPMVFFTVLGFVQCAIWLVEKDRARLGLGLTLLFGAGMAKFEGFIVLASVGGWMLLPSARPPLKPSPGLWRVLAFCFLAALPFICLRARIPALDYESGWTGYALSNPGTTLSNWPGIFMIILARLFVNPDFACWSGDDGRFHWIGRWDGFSSLYNNYSTLGLAWLCLGMTVALWFAVPDRRRIIVWTLAMFLGTLAAFSGVFASFVNITGLTQVISYSVDDAAGRYLLPMLLAWFATNLILLFADLSSPGAAPAVGMTGPVPLPAPPAANLRQNQSAATRFKRRRRPPNRALSIARCGGL